MKVSSVQVASCDEIRVTMNAQGLSSGVIGGVKCYDCAGVWGLITVCVWGLNRLPGERFGDQHLPGRISARMIRIHIMSSCVVFRAVAGSSEFQLFILYRQRREERLGAFSAEYGGGTGGGGGSDQKNKVIYLMGCCTVGMAVVVVFIILEHAVVLVAKAQWDALTRGRVGEDNGKSCNSVSH